MKISLSSERNGDGTKWNDGEEFEGRTPFGTAASLAVEQQQFCISAFYPRPVSLVL